MRLVARASAVRQPRQDRHISDVVREAAAASAEARMSAATRHLGSVSAQCGDRNFNRHVARFCQCLRDLQPYSFRMPFKRKDDLGSDIKNVGVLLPHEIFASFFNESPDDFAKVFGTSEDRARYWTEIGAKEPWFADHPNRDDFLHHPELMCPLALHGDDVAFKRGLSPLSALVQSISSPVSWHVFDAILLVCCVPLKWLQDDSL